MNKGGSVKLIIPRNEMKTWIRALRSGEYRQTTHELHSEKGHCCLGVACDLFIPKEQARFNSNGYLYGLNPSCQTSAPAWLQNIDLDFQSLVGATPQAMNDDHGFTFDEIADLLQAVYIHEVLS